MKEEFPYIRRISFQSQSLIGICQCMKYHLIQYHSAVVWGKMCWPSWISGSWTHKHP